MSLLLTNIVSIAGTYWFTTRTSRKVAEPPGGIAPFLRHLPLEPTPSRINTPFYDREKSIYRKRGSPETEKAWRELTQLGTFSGIV